MLQFKFTIYIKITNNSLEFSIMHVENVAVSAVGFQCRKKSNLRNKSIAHNAHNIAK